MNRNRRVALGYAVLCAGLWGVTSPVQAAGKITALNHTTADPTGKAAPKEEPGVIPREDAPGELKNNVPAPAPGSDHAVYLTIIQELGEGNHANVPKLLEICARNKGQNSFVRMSPAMLRAYERNYLLDQKAYRSTVALASVASLRHFMRVEDAEKLRIAIEDWQISPERLGLQPKELQFIKEHTADGRDLKLPVVKKRPAAPTVPPVLASRHAQEPLVKTMKKSEVKSVVKRRRRSVTRDAAVVDIRPAPSRKDRSTQ